MTSRSGALELLSIEDDLTSTSGTLTTMKQQTIQLGKRAREEDITSLEAKKHKPVADTLSPVENRVGAETTKPVLVPLGWPLTLSPPSFDIKGTFSEIPGQAIRKEPGLDLLFFKRFLKAPVRASLFKYLIEELPWYRVSLHDPIKFGFKLINDA
jgi:hypothetical protein